MTQNDRLTDFNLDSRFAMWSYNNCVVGPAPSKTDADDKHRHHHTAYAAEATGLLVIAVLLLILVLIRYWPYIPWGAR